MSKRKKQTNMRYHTLDEARGFAVLCMVFYHAFYTLSFDANLKIGEVLFDFFTPLEPFFAMFFIILSGVCCQLSRSNLKRGLKLAAVALLLTAVTVFLSRHGMEGAEIYFGILHLLAVGMLLVALINRLLLKLPPLITAMFFLVLFVFTYNIESGTLGFGDISFSLPNKLYLSDTLFFLGFHSGNFYSADYFPILPWIFMFLCGASIGIYAKRDKFPQSFKKLRIPFLSVIGKNALIIYILHQPVIYGLIYTVKFFISLF